MKKLLAFVAVLALAAPTAAAAAAARTTLGDVENEVMCPVCGTPLNVAESPRRTGRERDFIRAEVAQGKTKDQIKQDLVGQYGPNVLALPASGDELGPSLRCPRSSCSRRWAPCSC